MDCVDAGCEYDESCLNQDTGDAEPASEPEDTPEPSDSPIDTAPIDTGPPPPDTGDWPDGEWVVLASGGWHNCAVRQDQSAVCWGRNIEGH